MYDEFLSYIVSELEERFVNNISHSIATGLLHLVPSECMCLGDDVGVPEDLIKAVDLFEDDLPHPVMFTTEYGLWVRNGRNVQRPIPFLTLWLVLCKSVAHCLIQICQLCYTLP